MANESYTSYAYVPSAEASAAVGASVEDTSAFYLDVQCFLEGVQVPHSTVSVSYGINSPPTCTLLIPASRVIRDLPETTKIHVFFKDFLPTDAGVYEWRLLFDGELSSYDYSITSDGAYMQLNGIHSAAYMAMMQLLSLDVSEFIFNPNPQLVGNATIPMVLGQSKVNNRIIKKIIDGKNFNNMADIVYQLMKSVIAGVSDSAVGKYYRDKLDEVDGGWKITKRIFGITTKAAASTPVTFESQYDSSGKLKDKYVDTNVDANVKMSSYASGTRSSSGNVEGGLSSIDNMIAGPSNYVGASADHLSKYYTTFKTWNEADDFIVSKQSDAEAKKSYKGMNEEFIQKFDLLTQRYCNEKSDSTYRFTINSGYRSPSWNDHEGGVRNSKHTLGAAADISIPNCDPDLVVKLAKEIGFYVERNNAYGYIHVGVGG